MKLSWGEDYEPLADVARSFFAKYSALSGTQTRSAAEQYRELAALDWLGISHPLGDDQSAGLASVAAIFVEMGRALAVSPLLAALVSRELALATNTTMGGELADRVGQGEILPAPVLPDGHPATPQLSVQGSRLRGSALMVPFADQASDFVVHVSDCQGGWLLWLPTDQAVSVKPLPNIADYPLFSVTFPETDLSRATLLAHGADAQHAVARIARRAAVLQAAEVYGAGLRLLDITTAYACQRHQFGGPIGRFQAVQYLCTDIAIGVHLISVFARHTARLLDGGHPAVAATAMLRNHVSRTAQRMVHRAHEVHAGAGFMLDSKVHLFTRAAKRWQFAFGDEFRNQADVAQELCGEIDGVPA